MIVKPLQQLITLEGNEACEGSHHNSEHWCKNGKNHATLGKGNL